MSKSKTTVKVAIPVAVTALAIAVPLAILGTSKHRNGCNLQVPISDSAHILDFTAQGKKAYMHNPILYLFAPHMDNEQAKLLLSNLFDRVHKKILSREFPSLEFPSLGFPEDKQGNNYDKPAYSYFFDCNMYYNDPMINHVSLDVREKFFKTLQYWEILCDEHNHDRKVIEFLALQLALLNQHGGHCNERVKGLIMNAYSNTLEFTHEHFPDKFLDMNLTYSLKERLRDKLSQQATQMAPTQSENVYFVNTAVSWFDEIYMSGKPYQSYTDNTFLNWQGNEYDYKQMLNSIMNNSNVIKTLDEMYRNWSETGNAEQRKILKDVDNYCQKKLTLPFNTFCLLVTDQDATVFKQDLTNFIEKAHKEATDTTDEFYDEKIANEHTYLLNWVNGKTNQVNLNSLIESVIESGLNDEKIVNSNLFRYANGVKALVYLYLHEAHLSLQNAT